MSTYTPTVEEARLVWQEWNGYGGLINRTGPEPTTRADMRAEFDRMIAEVERAAAEKALTEFAAELDRREMPESGSHINMTKYREGLIDGVNRAVRAASRRAEAYRQEKGEQ